MHVAIQVVTAITCLQLLWNAYGVLNVTGFAKTIPNHTRTEIQFIAKH